MHVPSSQSEEPISVLIASSHRTVVAMIARFVECHGDEVVVAGVATTVADIEQAIERLQPDVVLLGQDLFTAWVEDAGASDVFRDGHPGLVVLTGDGADRRRIEWVSSLRLTTDLIPAFRRVTRKTLHTTESL